MTATLGYTIFYVHDVGTTLQFFVEAFGFSVRMHTPENDYGELETGQTVLAFVSIELAQANLDAAGGFATPGAVPAPASITLVTDDVPLAVSAAIDAGASMYVEPEEKPWGQTVSYVLGPDKILIEIASPVAG